MAKRTTCHGENFRYLGHFRADNVLKDGHNTSDVFHFDPGVSTSLPAGEDESPVQAEELANQRRDRMDKILQSAAASGEDRDMGSPVLRARRQRGVA